MPHWLVEVHEVQVPLVPVVVPLVVPLVVPVVPTCGHAHAPAEVSQVANPSQSESLVHGLVESQ